jgi:hypothetical protein
MEVAVPPHDPEPRPARYGPGAGALIIASCLACALAFGSLLGTAYLLERPDAAARVTALLNGDAIRTIADADLPRSKPLPDLRVGSVAGVDDLVTSSVGTSAAGNDGKTTTSTRFGVDLGSAASLAGLRDMWSRSALAQADRRLRALANIRDIGEGHELHLLVGPFANAADASALCAQLATQVPECAVVPFSGQDLSNP